MYFINLLMLKGMKARDRIIVGESETVHSVTTVSSKTRKISQKK